MATVLGEAGEREGRPIVNLPNSSLWTYPLLQDGQLALPAFSARYLRLLRHHGGDLWPWYVGQIGAGVFVMLLLLLLRSVGTASPGPSLNPSVRRVLWLSGWLAALSLPLIPAGMYWLFEQPLLFDLALYIYGAGTLAYTVGGVFALLKAPRYDWRRLLRCNLSAPPRP